MLILSKSLQSAEADFAALAARRSCNSPRGCQAAIAENRTLLRTIAERQPKSVTELATMTSQAEQNVLRTLNKLAAAGVVRLDKGEGRARRPVLAARKVHFEIDLLGAG
jgi:predicted transcriptional regulator